ncbi:MAG: M13 family metallopeptidase, partial [Bacteroidota bacterium]|nr:M13 family metallopeptidase [Bacteroidota bacterium]
MNIKYRSLLFFIALLFADIMSFSQTGAKKPLSLPANYIDKNNMDLSVKPGDNFFLYANGNWKKNNPVPASRTRWGSFDELREENSKRLSTLLEDAAKNTSRDRNTQIIGDFYASGMDSITIEKKGFDPIKPALSEIKEITSVADLLHEMAVLRSNGFGSAAFGAHVGADSKNVLANIPSLGQGGTNLPDRDYYLKDDARSVKIREAYIKNLQTLFSLVGEDANTAKANADAVIRIETSLAAAQLPRVELRDPYKTYNKFAVKDLTAMTPNINWATQLNDMKIFEADSVVVNNPAFFKSLDSLLSSISLNDWKSYLRSRVIDAAAPFL